eukprot:TRINITY_DN13715_c0_g3_i1.p1 TRINITY_DN13715_c0_g3~~TRINITY_DN13715_c0_g3_i1.p1  ORF type:complete len:245 (-),score=45.47 TRINITY_DN13715_c0_g3_i1:21-755(-)
MAVSLQCSLLGGPEFVGCGYSPSEDAADEQIEIEVQVPPLSSKPAVNHVLRLRSVSGGRRMMPAGKTGVRRTPSVETKHSSHQRYPSARVGREQPPNSRRPRATPCEWCGSTQECDCEIALNSMVAEAMKGEQSSSSSSTGKRRPLKHCEKPSHIKSLETTSTSEGSELQGEEQDNSQEEDSSAAKSEMSPGSDTGVPEEKDWRVRELRSRLSDLLGAPGSASSDSEAAASVSALPAEARRAVS